MDIYKSKFTSLEQEILALLCIKTGTKLNQRQISKLLKVSPTAVGKSIPSLKDLISKEKISNIILITLNRDNPEAIQLKRTENMKNIYATKLAEFLENELPGATVILFGSYSRGEDTINSDIDLAIIGRKEKLMDLERFEKMLERKIIINFYSSLKEVHKDLRENICNGIVISGGIEL